MSSDPLIISRLGHRGDGVAQTPDGALYVPYALPGETVAVAEWPGHPDRRKLLSVTVASNARVAPICAHFGMCGGCATQHLATAPYRAWKRDLVVAALSQAGIAADVGDLVDAHGAGRRRVVLHARRNGRILSVGFAALHSHHIVAIDRCPVTAKGLGAFIKAAWAIAEVLAPANKPMDIQVTATDAGLDVDVRGSGPVSTQASVALAQTAQRHGLARLTRHGELITQHRKPTVQIGRCTVPLPPGAFLQATLAGEETLAGLVRDHFGKAAAVADLFCGVGPFALRLAETSRVFAADMSDDAVAALRLGAASASGLKPIDAQVRDLFRRPLLAQELARFDAVVFDPPRQGAQAQARELAASKVPVVVAVSCSAATFARDAAILIAGGYRLTTVTPVDQFRYAAHVEIVARLAR